jgi:DNA repair exonuclease SbcCD nuclease subunit
MKTPLAILTSDWHIHKWKQFNENGRRLNSNLDLFRFFGAKAKELGVPILFCGDMFDNPKQVHNSVITKSIKAYKKYIEKEAIPFIAISGNHDQEEKNTNLNKSPSYLQVFNETFSTFKLIDSKFYQLNKIGLYGVEYRSANVGLKETIKDLRQTKLKGIKILMIHTDLHGALATDNRKVETVENIPTNMVKFFKGFDLVISGHIHKPQIIESNFIYMLGAPQQQNRGDSECEMGYWVLYSDKSLEFIPTNYPKFKEIKQSKYDTLNPDEKLKHYYTVIPNRIEKAKENISGFTQFSKKTDRTKIAKNWAKATGETNKLKIKTLCKILQ